MKKAHLKNILFLLLMVNIACSQDFELVDPNISELRDAFQNDEARNDIVYQYLIKNYKTVSEKTNIQKLDYDNTQVCAFEQSFEYNIKFSLENCQEAGGINMTLELPKIEEQKIKSWIEKIYGADLTDIPNEWYDGKNTYGPVGGEAGCYYELKAANNKWVITIYCGC